MGNAAVPTGLETAAPLLNADRVVLLNAIPGIVTALQQLAHVQKSILETQSGILERQTIAAPRFVVGAKQFRELGPAYFDGTGGPLAAEEWMRGTEDTLELLKYDLAGWVDLVKKQLKANARSWWDAVEVVLVKPITWATFKARFDTRYFPEASKRQLAEQFLQLKQNGRSVEKYHQEYVRLARFAPELVKKDKDNA